MERFTVVVTDDDWATTRVIKYNLENKDIQVLQADNALECLKLVSEGKVDLLLLDLGLPDFTGWGIISLLRLTPFLADIPVIVISGRTPDRGLMQLFKPEDYIQKPFDVRDLVNRVRKIIDAKRKHSETCGA